MFYKSLFNINFHHAFFLDEGVKKYSPLAGEEAMGNDAKKNAILRYNFQDFLKIKPTVNTKKLIRNQRIKIHIDKQGFSLLTNAVEKVVSSVKEYEPLIHLDDELTFTFAIYAKDEYFYNYTFINSIENNRLYLFSNTLTGITSIVDTIFSGDGIVNDSYCLSEDDTRLLIQLIQGEEQDVESQFSITRQISLINENENLSDSIKNAEIKTILNQYISTQKRKGLIGFIRLKAVGDGSNNLVNNVSTNQYIIKPTIDLTLKFDNRNTFWRYIKNTEILNTIETKPLTKNGFISIQAADLDAAPLDNYDYPNPDSSQVVKENDIYYSEIYL